MRHQHKGDPQGALQGLQLDLHLAPQLAVQCRQRLVQQQDFGFIHNSAGKGHTLLLPARHFPNPPGPKARQTHHIQRAVNLAGHLGAIRFGAALQQAVSDVCGHSQVWKQRVVLKHHVDRPAVGRHLIYVLAVKINLAACRCLKPRKHPQSRGLTTPRRPKQ